jgi:hypothetical protein
VTTLGIELVTRLPGEIRFESMNDYLGTIGKTASGDGFADARSRTGNDDGFVFEKADRNAWLISYRLWGK